MATLLVLLSLICTRWNISHQLLHSSAQIPWTSFAAGMLEDTSLVLLCLAASSLLSILTRISARFVFSFLALVIWAANLANSLYFSFFGARLDAWIAQLHARDSYQVGGSALLLATNLPIILSFLLFVAAKRRQKPLGRYEFPISVRPVQGLEGSGGNSPPCTTAAQKGTRKAPLWNDGGVTKATAAHKLVVFSAS